MPGFLSGLTRAATAGLSGALEGRIEGHRALIAEQARREAQARAAAAQKLAEGKEAHDQEQDRVKNLMAGYTAGSTHVEVEPPSPPAAKPVSFGDALEGGLGPFAPASRAEAGAAVDPAPTLTTPLTEGSLGSIPKVRVTSTPESFDPTRSAQAAQIGMRGDQARLTAADQHTARTAEIALREQGQDRRNAASNATRIRAAEISANARTGGGAGGGRALTANGQESAKKIMLDGWMQYHGSEAALRQYLEQSDVAKGAAARLGITDADITAAVGRSTGKATDQSVRIDPRHPDKAVATINKAAAAVRTSRQAPTTPRAGTEGPPRASSAPAPAAPRAPDTASFDKEAAMYQRAVQAINTNFQGAERAKRLKAASDLYNSRVAGVAGRR